PHELLGHSPPHLYPDIGYVTSVKRNFNPYTSGNIIMATFSTTLDENTPVCIRSHTFACNDVYFGVFTIYPNTATDERQSSDSESSSEESAESKEGVGVRSFDILMMHSMWASYQACIVLRGIDSDSPDFINGPRIVFATESICTVLNASSTDLQYHQFLKLVITQDIVKASLFLDSLLHSNVIVIERLRVFENPFERRNTPGNPRIVTLEFLGMRSEDGFLLLCQLERPRNTTLTIRRRSSHLSLRDIVSSEPSSSHFPSNWKKIDI
ncbi:hypothetical protein GGI12_004975, partial [Dipsacomyces acuminosporus]